VSRHFLHAFLLSESGITGRTVVALAYGKIAASVNSRTP
jgi:hypothetical protein